MRDLVPRTLTVALLFGLLAACSTDTPTAPERTPAPPPGTGGPSASWNITVTTNQSTITQNSAQPATVTIQARRADTGQAAPEDTTLEVTANLGDFNSAGSGEQLVTVILDRNGLAQLLYFAADILGTDVIEATLESSFGRALIEVVEAQILFITSVSPQSGPEAGGTTIRIEGAAFAEPLRVTVGDILASIRRVANDGSFIRAVTGAVVDPDAFFATESCDSDGDGTLDGQRFVAKTVDVVVELNTGSSASLPAAFTYRPANTGCRDVTPDPDRPRAKFSFVVNGLTVLFTNESTPDGVTSTWVFGDGSAQSSEENPIHTYAAAGSYDVTLRVTNASGADTVTKTVTVP